MKENTFTNNVITLMAGTGAAQVITLLLTFIVTRLFSPEDFTSLEHYAMILSVLSVFSTFKMELAIVLAKTKQEALAISKWTMRRAVYVSIISLAVVVLFNNQISAFFQNDHLRWFLYLIPFNLFLLGAHQVLVYWHHRNKSFKISSFSKVLFNAANELSKITTGLIVLKPAGLIVSNFLARLVSVVYLFRKALPDFNLSGIPRTEELAESAKHSEFYKFSVWGSFLAKLSTWAHVILFSHLFGLWSIGFFALSRRLVLNPLSIFSQSFSQVFYQEISAEENVARIKRLFFKFFFRLVLIAAIMIGIVLLIPNSFYSLVLGEKWELLGDFMRLLIVWFGMNFITNCLAFVNYRLKKQKQMLFLDGLHFIIVVGSIYCGYYLGIGEWKTLQLFVMGKVLYFAINISAMIYFVLSSDKFNANE